MRVVDELSRLVAFDTVSSRPVLPLVDHLADRLEQRGFRTRRIGERSGKQSLLATAGPEGTDGLTLSGHLDVVPTEGQPWSSDPFTVIERGGRLYGRGTADMKGFLAALWVALDDFDVRSVRRELALVLTCDEEVGCLGSAEVVAAIADRPPLPRACLIGEPTGFCVFRMHPGHVHVAIDVHGEAAHSSRPELGANAIETAADIVAEARALARELKQEADHQLPLEHPWVALNVGRIHGGTAVNIVPDHCHLELGYRPLPGRRAESVFERLSARLPRPERVKVTSRIDAMVPALLTPDGTDLAAWLSRHAEPGPVAAPFATDGGNLALAGMLPLIFGPGSIDVAHKADEYVDGAALLRTVDILRDLIGARCT